MIGLLTVLWLLVVSAGSLLPVQAKIAIGTVGPAHDGVHVFVFGATAVLLMLWAKTRAQEFGFASAAFMIGVGIEIAQKFLSGNSMEWGDVQTDALGSLLALMCMQFRTIRTPLERLARRGLEDE